jgi:hypothetical protein
MRKIDNDELEQFIKQVDASLEIFKQTYTEEELKEMEDDD